MGLDMYLQKRTWIGVATRETMELKGVPDTVEPSKVTYIAEDAGYWRKANAIHRWFVEHVQDGRDDCRRYDVSRDQLESLLGKVDAVLAHPDMAPRLLPTKEGFYFGSTEYDEGYVADLKQTQKILVEALVNEDAQFEYSSSW